MVGSGHGYKPSMKCRSEWQRPATLVRISTSRDPLVDADLFDHQRLVDFVKNGGLHRRTSRLALNCCFGAGFDMKALAVCQSAARVDQC